MATPTVTHGNGMVVATGVGPQYVGQQQNLKGGLLNHAVEETSSRMKAQAAHAKSGGVTMRGGAINVPHVAEGGTIPGVSFTANHSKLISGLNQLQADKTYDHLAGTQPYKVGGRKRRTKTKKNGRRKSRNNKRSFRRKSRNIRRKSSTTK
jgi:hypothetical protein